MQNPFLCQPFAGEGARATLESRQKEKADHVSMIGLYLCRQRPTLPHTFACSTIGPAGLNCRVRDGNGWIPRGKITDNLRRLAGVNETAARRRMGACCRNPEAAFCAAEGSRYAISVSLRSDDLSKNVRNDASQLNRLGWLTFIFGYFRFQPNYIGFSSAHNRHFSPLSAAQILAAVEIASSPVQVRTEC
jgi:hypothetical protein